MASRIFLWLAGIGAIITCLLVVYTYMGGAKMTRRWA